MDRHDPPNVNNMPPPPIPPRLIINVSQQSAVASPELINADSEAQATRSGPELNGDACSKSSPTSQKERADSLGERPDVESTNNGGDVSPGLPPRPTVEKLDRDEVARDIAKQLAEMRPYATKPTQVIPRPPTHPFSGTKNPDAIAIRATASLLQTQKARATQHIEDLEIIKQAAMTDPERFVDALVSGDLKAGKSVGEGIPEIPKPQSIYRMPAVNWAKYGIVGEVLDKMHEEQRTHPSLGEPEMLDRRDSQPVPVDLSEPSAEKAPKYYLAKAYSPFDTDNSR